MLAKQENGAFSLPFITVNFYMKLAITQSSVRFL